MRPVAPRAAGRPGPAALAFGLAAFFLATVLAADPRITLIELQIASNHDEALRLLEELMSEDPEAAHRLGLHYLRGHLLLQSGRRQEAFEAFARVMSATPQLSAFSRYRLALEQERLGHPEVAAGLVATLLRTAPPRSLVGPSVELLRRSVLAGGDCRVLEGIEAHRFRSAQRRELILADAECKRRAGEVEAAGKLWLRLLEDEQGDLVARLAAGRLAASGPEKKSARAHYLLGLAFYGHRELDAAIHHLARALIQLPSPELTRREVFDLRYALARSHFWKFQFATAAVAFAALEADTLDAGLRGRVLYQQGRSLELADRWDEALEVFERAGSTAPSSPLADAALIAQVRLRRLRGEIDTASLEALFRGRHHSTASRALLFLAATDLALGEVGRAEPWLDRVAELARVPVVEHAFWRGRAAELRGEPRVAVRHYLDALADDLYHPLAVAARRRLDSPGLRGTAQALTAEMTLAVKAAPSAAATELYRAWLLLAADDPRRSDVHQRLLEAVKADRRASVFVGLSRQPPASWPLWHDHLQGPEEMLLALGLFAEGGSQVMRHFPVAEPELALTGSLVLAHNGDVKRSLYIAEILLKRVPPTVPPPLLPTELRRLLYPFHYRETLVDEARQRRVDPHLLAAIIREESRFDPRAFSTASARGLTQFLYPTAQEIAASIGAERLEPEDLERPEVSIRLGAAYLRQLLDAFDGSLPAAVAAYNAGEPQAALWRRYCVSDEPEEYLTKVAFRETRGYLRKVLSSRAQYAELYPLRPAG